MIFRGALFLSNRRRSLPFVFSLYFSSARVASKGIELPECRMTRLKLSPLLFFPWLFLCVGSLSLWPLKNYEKHGRRMSIKFTFGARRGSCSTLYLPRRTSGERRWRLNACFLGLSLTGGRDGKGMPNCQKLARLVFSGAPKFHRRCTEPAQAALHYRVLCVGVRIQQDTTVVGNRHPDTRSALFSFLF